MKYGRKERRKENNSNDKTTQSTESITGSFY